MRCVSRERLPRSRTECGGLCRCWDDVALRGYTAFLCILSTKTSERERERERNGERCWVQRAEHGNLSPFVPSFLPLSGKADTAASYSLREILWNLYSIHSSSSDGNGFRTWIDIRRFSMLYYARPIQSKPPLPRTRPRFSTRLPFCPSSSLLLSSSPPLPPAGVPKVKPEHPVSSRLIPPELRKPAALQTRPFFFLCFSMLFCPVLSCPITSRHGNVESTTCYPCLNDC